MVYKSISESRKTPISTTTRSAGIYYTEYENPYVLEGVDLRHSST